jgi:WD40 repeat protein
MIYDIDSGAVVAELEIESEIIAMTATSDGSLLFVGDGAGLLRVFDTTTWEPIAVWQAHEAFLRGLAVSPDAARLVTTGHDNLVKVWDIGGLGAGVSLGQPPPLLDRIPGYFASDAAWLSPDRLGVFLATDAGYLVVSLSVDDLTTEAAQRLTRGFTVGECLRYQIDPCPTFEEIRRR